MSTLASGVSPLSPRLRTALVLSALAHLFLLFGLHFTAPVFTPPSESPLEVVLINTRSERAPLKADALAQANSDGGGEAEDKRQRAKSFLPVSPRQQLSPTPGPAPAPVPTAASDPVARPDPPRPTAPDAPKAEVQRLEAEARQLMTQLKAPRTIPAAPPAEAAASGTPAPTDKPLSGLAARSLQMARLEAQIDKDYNEYQKRPRRFNIRPSTREYVFAQYAEDWRLKAERVGNLNYPDEAKRKKIYGSLALTVWIKADGAVEKVDVDRSSGQAILDDAAVRIVRLAAPYAPFTAAMRKEADIVSITRTWTFTREDELRSN